jgi:outer membrane protein assembly factor BamD (BamD/ComL family)
VVPKRVRARRRAVESCVASRAAAKTPGVSGKDARKLVLEIRKQLGEVVKKARTRTKPTDSELAKRLVTGQLKLSDHDPEGAAIVFLDLLENHPQTDASRQALVYLGEALLDLDMDRWASECFGRNLGDRNPEAARFHQRSLANLLQLAAPARKPGFAQRPGLSATPEVRARLEAIGLDASDPPPESLLEGSDIQRVIDWVQRIPLDRRMPMLSYAYGRWLYLSGFHDHALSALDGIAPPDEGLGGGGPARPYRLRATYIASSARLAQDKLDEAVAGFDKITGVRTTNPDDAAIVELAWMALGRTFHDSGEVERSVAAYRKISRDSKYFPEAMYETAWTLLRAGRNQGALQALDLLLVYDPASPIAPEIKQLRGKIRIQERDWTGAEAEFLALRREFAALGRQVQGTLRSQADATLWFSAVVGEDMPHFSIDAIMPVDAARLAESLPRAVQGRDLAQEVGKLAVELEDVRALLAKMETAVAAKEHAALFHDLGALMSSADAAELQLIDVQEAILDRTLATAKNSALDKIDKRRKQLRKVVEDYDTGSKSSAELHERIRKLAEVNHRYELAVVALRAQLVAAERYYEQTRTRQKLDHAAFLKQAAERPAL